MKTPRKAFLAATAASAATLVPAVARAAEYEFKCGSELAADHPTSARLTQMWAAIEKESNGRIRTQFYPNSALGSPSNVFSQIRVGAVQFDLLAPANISAVVPPFDIVNLGFAWKDSEEAERVTDGPLGDFLRNEAEAKGFYVLKGLWDVGMIDIGSALRPVRAPDDLRGFRVRVSQSKIAVDLFKELGANPTPLPFDEVYTGVQSKIIDGEASPMLSIFTQRFYEVQKYVSLTHHAWGVEALVANGDVWKNLPADLRGVIERNHARYLALARNDTKAANASLVQRLTRLGQVVNTVDQDPFRARLGAYYQTWSAAFGPSLWALLQNGLGRKLF